MCIFGYRVRSPADVRRVPEVPEERPFLAEHASGAGPSAISDHHIWRNCASNVGLLSLTLASGLGVGASGSAWAHAPGSAPGALAPATARTAPDAVARGDVHDLPSPLESKRRELRQEALTDVIDGAATAQQRNGSTVVEVGRSAASHPSDKHSREATRRHQPRRHGSQYVELRREKTDKIFVILAEFGNQRHPSYPDQDTDPSTPGPAVFDGPLHNSIPAPDRTRRQLDRLAAGLLPRSTTGSLYFGTGPGVESLKTYYERQSSGPLQRQR